MLEKHNLGYIITQILQSKSKAKIKLKIYQQKTTLKQNAAEVRYNNFSPSDLNVTE